MTTHELAQQILDLIKEVDDQWTASTETVQRDLLMNVVDDIEKLCKEQVKEVEGA